MNIALETSEVTYCTNSLTLYMYFNLYYKMCSAISFSHRLHLIDVKVEETYTVFYPSGHMPSESRRTIIFVIASYHLV